MAINGKYTVAQRQMVRRIKDLQTLVYNNNQRTIKQKKEIEELRVQLIEELRVQLNA